MKATFPVPPSSNRYWRVGRGRLYKSKIATTYQDRVFILARLAGWRPIDGDVRLTVTWFRKAKQGDVSNRIKVLEDALQGVAYTNDNQVAELHMYRQEDKNRPRVEITVEAI